VPYEQYSNNTITVQPCTVERARTKKEKIEKKERERASGTEDESDFITVGGPTRVEISCKHDARVLRVYDITAVGVGPLKRVMFSR